MQLAGLAKADPCELSKRLPLAFRGARRIPLPRPDKLRKDVAEGGPRTQIGRMKQLKALWRGDLSLGDAFWTWTVVTGLVVNVVTSILFAVLITKDLAVPALIFGYGLSIPYNILAVVGVWRSAARHDGPGLEAVLARWASVILMTVLSLT